VVLVPSFLALLQPLSAVMTAPSFNTFLTLLTGWVFARRRTVTGMILAARAVGTKHHSAFHRFFAAAQWSLDELGLAVFALIQPHLEPGAILLALDDTLARKCGKQVFGAGMHHDPRVSSRGLAVMNWGHSWVHLGVLVNFRFAPQRWFCLPILFRLYRSRQTVARHGGRYRTRPELALEVLHRLCTHTPRLRFHVVADAAYGGQNVLKYLPLNCHLTSRLVMDARLYAAPPPRRRGQSGRPRRRGPRLPTPEQMLRQRAQRVTLHIYGRDDRVRMAETLARVHAVPWCRLRVVAVEPLTGGRPRQAFYSTDVSLSAEQILVLYARRWAIEQSFQEGKTQLGFEQPQGWTRRAVERTAPTAMLLYSLIVLWFAGVGHRSYRPLWRPWYRSKAVPSFADMLATLRRESVRARVLSPPARDRGCRNLLATLMHVVQQAA
jgi:hypothetical protein